MKFPFAYSVAFFALCFSVINVHAEKMTVINGAGATFPYPLYSKWFSEFKKLDPESEINYQSIGSGGGIRQLLDKTVDFGASDAPMSDEQLAKSAVPIFHIPTVLGAVAVTYQVPGVSKELRLSSDALVNIFLGKIQKWNDPAIAKLNPGLTLPADLPIIVAYRSDGSGTTAVFTDYLAKISPDWKKNVGSGPAVRWPVGIGGKGNEGVAGLVKQTPGSIAYVELTYAISNHLPVVSIGNRKGEFIAPSSASVTQAARAGLSAIPADFRVSITDSEGKGAYPISSFTYLLVYKKMDLVKAGKLVRFMNWALTTGQKFAAELSYAPLPKELVNKIQKTVSTVDLK